MSAQRYAIRFFVACILILMVTIFHWYIVSHGMAGLLGLVSADGTFLRFPFVLTYVILTVVASAYAWLSLISMIGARGSSGSFFRSVHRDGLLRSISRRISFPAFGLYARLFLIGCLVFAFVLMLENSGKCDDVDIALSIELSGPQVPVSDPAAKMVVVNTFGMNLHRYYRVCQRVASDLLQSGAGTVVMAVAPRSLGRIDRMLFDSLVSTRHLVLYAGGPEPPDVDSASLASGRPFFALPGMSYHEPYISDRRLFFYRWQPLRSMKSWRLEDPGTAEQVDVSLVAAGRYLGIDDTVRPIRRGNSVVYGELRIPTSGGYALSQRLWRHYRTFMPVSVVSAGSAEDSLDYEYVVEGIGRSKTIPPLLIPEITGKIIFLHWNAAVPLGYGLAPLTNTSEYCDIVESLVNHTVLRKIGWSVSVMALVVILIAIGAFGRYRLWLSTLITVGAGFLFFALSVFIFSRWGVILGGSYLLIASWLCALAFPIVRKLHECGA